MEQNNSVCLSEDDVMQVGDVVINARYEEFPPMVVNGWAGKQVKDLAGWGVGVCTVLRYDNPLEVEEDEISIDDVLLKMLGAADTHMKLQQDNLERFVKWMQVSGGGKTSIGAGISSLQEIEAEQGNLSGADITMLLEIVAGSAILDYLHEHNLPIDLDK